MRALLRKLFLAVTVVLVSACETEPSRLDFAEAIVERAREGDLLDGHFVRDAELVLAVESAWSPEGDMGLDLRSLEEVDPRFRAVARDSIRVIAERRGWTGLGVLSVGPIVREGPEAWRVTVTPSGVRRPDRVADDVAIAGGNCSSTGVFTFEWGRLRFQEWVYVECS